MLSSYGMKPHKEVTLNSGIESLELPTRVYNSLKRLEINTIEDLVETGVRDIAKSPSVGAFAITHIKRVLSLHARTWQSRFIERRK